MTTETPPIDPIVDAWSDRLEDDLVEAGMAQAQARAYRYAFELGLTRVISQTATKQELKDAIAGLRGEMRFLFLLVGGIITALLSAILAIVA